MVGNASSSDASRPKATKKTLVRGWFSTKRDQRDPYPRMVLDRARPKRPLSADGSRPCATKETLVRGWFSTCRLTETPIGGCLFPLGTEQFSKSNK